MVDTPGGAVGSAPVAYQPLGSSYTFRQAEGAASGSATATGYITADGWSGTGQADGTCFLICFTAWLYSGVGSVDGTSTAEAGGVMAIQGEGSVSGTSSVSGEGASLAAGTGLDRSEPFGYGGPVGTTALGQLPLAYSNFDATGCTVYGFSAQLIAQAGQAAGTSDATAIQGYIGSAAGSTTADATVGFIGSASGTVSVDGYLNVYGEASGSSTAEAIAGHQGIADGSSTAEGVNGSIASCTGSATGSCTVNAYLLWQETTVTGTLWNFDKYTSGNGGPVGSITVGAIPLAATDVEPGTYSADWLDDPIDAASWEAASTPTTPDWQPVTTTSTTWQKAA